MLIRRPPSTACPSSWPWWWWTCSLFLPSFLPSSILDSHTCRQLYERCPACFGTKLKSISEEEEEEGERCLRPSEKGRRSYKIKRRCCRAELNNFPTILSLGGTADTLILVSLNLMKMRRCVIVCVLPRMRWKGRRAMEGDASSLQLLLSQFVTFVPLLRIQGALRPC